MVVCLRIAKGWSNIIAAFCMYGLCYSVVWVDRMKVTSAGEHVIPLLTFTLVAVAGICSLAKYKTRLIHGLVGIFLMIACTVSLVAYHDNDPRFDFYHVASQPELMIPIVVAIMFAAGIMVFTEEHA
jgi:hypothetical protein